MKEDLLKAMQDAIMALNKYGARDVVLVHHNDTDGITSGVILQTALAKEGYAIERYSLEKPYPEVLEKIFKNQSKIIIFADFAARVSPLISKLNIQRNLVLILDHHTAVNIDDKMIYNLNGDLFGLRGDRDLSASVTCYLFARLLNTQNQSLAPLAVLGAVGDGFYENGSLVSINREAVDDAVAQNNLRINRKENRDKYYIKINNQEHECEELSKKIDILGAVGYYQGGVDKGIEVCMHGIDRENEQLIERLKKTKETLFKNEIDNLDTDGLHSEKNIQWFDVKERFAPMGVKMIGVFCNELKDSKLIDHNKYLAGYQTIPDEVPGFGKIDFQQTKISMRVSRELTDKILSEEKKALNEFLPMATRKLNGFVDACHRLAAATTVKIGLEKNLIEEMEKILEE